ncbi:MAG: LamG-like jellyroll fold domain-containing protein, partial [Armatimonadota bacterium]
ALEPGALYRLRFHALADEKAADALAVCLHVEGEEGPFWLYRPVQLEPGDWRPVEIVFRAQSGFNPLHTAGVEFRLNQWRPDFSWRPNRPHDREVEQTLYLDAVSLEPVPEGEAALARMTDWLVVPGHDDLRMAEVEFGLGDGIGARPGSLHLSRDGAALERVEYLEDVSESGRFAFSERSGRIYVRADQTDAPFALRYIPEVDERGDAMLAVPAPDAGRALRDGAAEVTRVPLQAEALEFDRVNWPITQGLPFPPGVVADAATIRVLGPDGLEVPAQVRPTSFWADDSIRWALLDFCVDAPAGEAPEFMVEFGPDVARAEIVDPVAVTEDGGEIRVDAGRVQFRVSKTDFTILDDLVVDGRRPLDGPVLASVTEDTGGTFTTGGSAPYAVAVEEAGPMRAVIAVRGWNTDEDGERFLTHTTRIHAYRDQPFVRVFHTLTNRHEEQVTGQHHHASGWPDDPDQYSQRSLMQRNIADATLTLPVTGLFAWEFDAGDRSITGDVAQGAAVHRQTHHAEGLLRAPGVEEQTAEVPGVVTVTGDQGAVTAAIWRYSNLFPKETRISLEGLELGLIPCSADDPHPLLNGTARTTEIMLAFAENGSDAGADAARAFRQPTILANDEWYCASRGFMGDELVPENPYTVATYDRIMDSYVENNLEPYPPGVDDCGLMNFGDFTYTGYNIWLNLEYDGDLGLYMHFARSGDRRAFVRALDGSRHFLDADTGWYTGEFDTHGMNFPHDVAHYNPVRPCGHIYTAGLMHYYLLTGDRRALEATRLAADAVNRVLYHRIHQYASAFAEDDPVAVWRGYTVPGGSSRSANSRETSDPARYALHAYVVTGEARFLEAARSLADALALTWPANWLRDDDQYIHYRWPGVLGKLYDITGAQRYGDLLVRCGEWMLQDPYSKYGEFRVGQSYGFGPQVPGRTNNTRMLFLTAWAWKITGEREYLDWLINMYDAQMERERHRESFNNRHGKSLGKYADNPARGLPWIVPHRTVTLHPGPERFQLTPPGDDTWTLAVGNRSETALEGTVQLGPLPPGVVMETERDFALELGEEIELEFAIGFTDDAPTGRVKVPYRVATVGADGREGERNGFFAAHLLRPRAEEAPELLFHAPLDDDSPAFSHGGDGTPVFETHEFIDGRFGRAIGPMAGNESWAFDLTGSIFPDEGTFSVWIQPTGRTYSHIALRVRGHGWPFLYVDQGNIAVGDQRFRYRFDQRPEEWIHVAMTWDLQELAYYIDGERVFHEERANYEIPTGELWGLPVGTMAVDDIRVYSVALEADRIAELAGEE